VDAPYPELEIGLHRVQADAYQVELRFLDPASDAETLPRRATCPLDTQALLPLHLDPPAYGRALAAQVFADPEALAYLRMVRTAVESSNRVLRLRLLIGATAAELHALRWELLCDPDSGAPLATSERVLFSRFMQGQDWRAIRLRPRAALRALVAVAAPTDLAQYGLAPVDLAGEVQRARDALAGIAIEVVGQDQPLTIESLHQALRQGVDVLYLVAHGTLSRAQGPVLFLQDDQGLVQRVAGDNLARRIAELREPPRLLVLASCEGAASLDAPYARESDTPQADTKSEPTSAQAALAPRLAAEGVPAILAMQGKIGMATVAAAMPRFFSELLTDGQIDRALAVARGQVRHRRDAWMPALFLRLRGGRIWSDPAAPAPKPKPINLPYHSLDTLFKGREDLLADLHAGFRREPGRPQVIVVRQAIHGLGGIGKTRAAVEYAWRHVEDYSALLFLTAQSPADLHAKLAALCGLLGLAQGVTEEAERMRAALRWLGDPAHAGWLLIADNVDTEAAAEAVEQVLANLSGGHLLITGRLNEWPGDIRTRRVDVLDPAAARDFLLERTAGKRRNSPDDNDQALTLAGDLGYLALALEQAAAFIRRHALGLADCRRRWQRADHKVLQWHDPRTMQYERPLAATWQTTVDGLTPAAQALLQLLAWLAPEPLPRLLFDHAAAPEGLVHLFEDRENPRAILARLSGDPDADPEEALVALRDHSLLQPSEGSEVASEGQVHRVLALITRERQQGEERTAALQAALALVDAAAVGEPWDVRRRSDPCQT
jgi:hypothetical protein